LNQPVSQKKRGKQFLRKESQEDLIKKVRERFSQPERVQSWMKRGHDGAGKNEASVRGASTEKAQNPKEREGVAAQ